MKHKQTRFMPIAKRETVGAMVAGDKMMAMQIERFRREEEANAAMLMLCREALVALKALNATQAT